MVTHLAFSFERIICRLSEERAILFARPTGRDQASPVRMQPTLRRHSDRVVSIWPSLHPWPCCCEPILILGTRKINTHVPSNHQQWYTHQAFDHIKKTIIMETSKWNVMFASLSAPVVRRTSVEHTCYSCVVFHRGGRWCWDDSLGILRLGAELEKMGPHEGPRSWQQTEKRIQFWTL